MTRVNGRAIEDYKRFDVLETGLAVPKAEPLYIPTFSNGYAPYDFIVDANLVLYLPLYLLKGDKFKSVDRYQHTCTVSEALWRPNYRYFDSVDDKISIPSPSGGNLNITGSITLIAWVNQYGDKEAYGIVGKKQNYVLGIFTNNLTFAYYGPADQIYVADTFDLTDDTWECVGATFTFGTGASVKLFASGVEQAGTWDFGDGAAAAPANAEPLNIGYDAYIAAYARASIGEVWIYNRLFSLADYQHVRNATMWRYWQGRSI